MTETAIQTRIGSLSEIMAQKYNMDWTNFLNTFKATVFKSCKKVPTNEEVAMMMMVCKQYDLNPFIGQIFAFLAKNGGIIPVVGIDGFVTIAERHKDFDGYEITQSENIVTADGGKPCPEWMEIKIWRKNLSHPIIVREYLDECYVSPRSGFSGPWQTHTKRMLRHKLLVQGNRVAFAITGIYDEDEAHRINEAVSEIKTKPAFVSYEEKERQLLAEPEPEKPAEKNPEVAPENPAPAEYKQEPVEPPKLDGEQAPYGKANKVQIKMIEDNVKIAPDPSVAMNFILKRFKVERYADLTSAQAEEVIGLQDRAKKDGKK